MFKRGEKKAMDATKRFKLGECLGKGAFASVYRAVDKQNKLACAIKKMSLSNAPNGAQPMTEYELGKSCNHDHVVKTLDCVSTKEHLYIVLELVDGGDLFSQLDPSGPGISEEKARRFALELAMGIEYLHSKDVVHCDIKPENTLVHNGHIKICDFGLAGYTGTERQGAATGTGAYMAPELINRRSSTPYYLHDAHDVWSFGVVMYAILFADLPWEKARVRDQDFALYCKKGGVSSDLYPFNTVSKYMRALMRSALAIKPSNRPAMDVLVRHLKQGHAWYNGKKQPIMSYGMRELTPEEIAKSHVVPTKTLADVDAHSTVSSSSLPSIQDAFEPVSGDKYTTKKPVRNSKQLEPSTKSPMSPITDAIGDLSLVS